MLSLILGFLSSTLPGILKMFENKSNQGHELEIEKLRLQYGNLNAGRDRDTRIIESEQNAASELYKSEGANLSRTDVWVNNIVGLIRPIGAVFSYAVIGFVIYHSVYGDPNTAETLLGIPLIVETVSYIIGFWFGHRSMIKLAVK